jgi:hypothetical protein
LPSKFFPANFFFYILEKGNLAGKNLLSKRVNLLCKEGFFQNLFMVPVQKLTGPNGGKNSKNGH